MSWTEVLAAGLLLGVAGSAHCAAMCGAFALRAGSAGRPLLAVPLYLAGKTFTYVLLGTAAGAAGARLVQVAGPWQAALGVAAGAALLLAGVNLLRPLRAESRIGAAWGRLLAPFFRAVRGAHASGGPFALGTLTGALPCGVSYLAALQAAASGSPVRGAALMAAFGAGTAPVLAVTAFAGAGALARLSPARLRVAGGVLVLAAGAVAIARAAPVLLAGGGAACCSH